MCECVEPSCAQCVPNWTKLELRCVMLAPSLPKLATKLPKLAPSCFQYELLNVFAFYFFKRCRIFYRFFNPYGMNFCKLLDVFEVEIQCFRLGKKPFLNFLLGLVA